MSVVEHRGASAGVVPCYVLTVSDSRSRETDTSGQAVASLLVEAGHTIIDHALVPDEPARVADLVRGVLQRGDVRAIITTGGTGIAPRDSTVEALAGLFDRQLPGFGELFRMLSFEQIGPAAMLSRATAGTAGRHVLFLLPGSEHAVRLAMTRLILPELGHVVRELSR